MRFIPRLIVLSAVALALVACGGDTASEAAKGAASSAGDAATSAAAEASAAAKETILAAEDAVAEARDVVAEAKEGVAEAAAGAGSAEGAAAGPDLAAGEKTYGRFCFSCHAAGVAGAPKLGVADDWAPRSAKGLDAMLASTIEGIPPGMPARGLCMNCSDDDLRNAVAWMSAQQ